MTYQDGDTFTVEITLGNAASQTPQDVAGMLRDVARRLDEASDFFEGRVRDVNGNTVGTFGAAL